MTSKQIRESAKKVSTLSSKQFKILSMKINGYSAQTIGASLNLKPQNIHRTADKMYKQLGIHCIADAVRVAIVAGIINDQS